MSKKKQSKNSPSAKDKRAAAAAVTENSKNKKQQHNTEQHANGVVTEEASTTTTANGDGKTQQVAGKSSKQQQQQLPQLQAPKGLPNLGNTCFYNTLQCLLNTHPLAHYFAQIQQRTSIVVNKPYIAKVGDKSVHIPQLEAQLDQQHPQMPAFFALRKLFLEYTEANGRQPNPRQLFEQISRVVPRFRGWNQQDAHELLVYLLDILRTNEIRHIERGLDEQLKHEDTKEAKERRVLLNKALLDGPARPMLDAVFGGQLQQTIRCTRCHQISVSLEPFFVLSLPIRAEAIKSTPTVYHPTTTAKRGHNNNNKKVEEEEKKKKKELAAAAKQKEELQQPQQNGLHQQNGTTSSKPDKTTDAACPMETPNKVLMSKHQLKKHEKADRKKRKLEGKRLNKRRQSNPSSSGQPPAAEDEAAQNSQKTMDEQEPDDEQLCVAARVEESAANDAQNEGQNGGKSGTNDDVIDDVDQEMNQALKDYDQEMKAFVKAQLYQGAFGNSADGMDDPDLLLAMAESQLMAEDAQCGWLPNGAFPANEDIFTVTATAAEEQPSANGGQNEGGQQNDKGGQNGGTMNPNAGETMGIFREEIKNGKAKMQELRFYGAALGLTFKETMEMDDSLLMAMYHSLQQLDNNAAEKSAIPSSNEDTFTVTVTVEEPAAASNEAQNEAQNKEEENDGVKTPRTDGEGEAAHCQQKWNSELAQKLKARLKARLLDDADFRCPENGDEMDPEQMDPDLFVALAEKHAVDTHQMGWNNNCSTEEGSDPEADFAVIEHEDREEALCPPKTTPCAPNSSPTVEEEEEAMVFEVPTPADEPCQSPTADDEAADNANENGEEKAGRSAEHNTADGQQEGEEKNGESKEEDENEGEDENGEEDESESNCNGHGQQQKFQQQNPLNPSGVRALVPEAEAMDSLHLHLMDSKQLSVEAALWNFTSTDELSPTTSGYCCGKCAQAAKRKGHKPPEPVTAFKRYLILSPPTILTLHLKRFEQLGGPRTPMKKFSGHLKFGLQLDLGPFCSDRVKHILPGQRHIWYSLYGVVCHSGGLSGGHYIAYVRNRPEMMDAKGLERFFQKTNSQGKQTPAEEAEKLEKLFRKLALSSEEDADGRERSAEACNTVEAEEKSALEQAQQQLSSQWFHCSDSYVHKVCAEEVLNAQAYLLFYERMF